MLDIVISSRQAEIIPGFVVKRLLPYQLRRMVGPFIFMDHGGPVSIPTAIHSDLDVLPHPHIGLSTVSYLFSGEIMHRFSNGVDPVIVAAEHTTLMMLGGEHLGERYIWWNFVSSRRERIEQAKEDWKQGRILLPPADKAEFIPLPATNSRPAGGPPPNTLS
ncbi:pirin-like C-terminal cupin domain-containing protein [Dyadobacter alkalitolerans]|uniref:pirin-like C-terminal cupin domain-containing protein n=1 Tax=Dyadobacter alkalitolerans TaxID=492736 RepID=UPI00047CD751|nr:pirin-like C-terminal cupin domain-containing protein [Dyadobacter alkalitolerans]